MKKVVFTLIVIASFQFVNFAENAGKNHPEVPGKDNPIVGKWATFSISGDALFFIISKLEGKMDSDGNFSGKVYYTDDQTDTQKGKYKIDSKFIYIYTADSKTPYKLKYSYKTEKKKVLKVSDENFGVSIKLQRQ